MLDLLNYQKKLAEAVAHYERTAPTVAEHCDDLFIRMNEAAERVTLAELNAVAALWSSDWLQPNYAANHVYHLRHRLGFDVVGHAGY